MFFEFYFFFKLYDPFIRIEFTCHKTAEPVQGHRLLKTTKFPESTDAHLANLRMVKGCVSNPLALYYAKRFYKLCWYVHIQCPERQLTYDTIYTYKTLVLA